MTSLIGLEWKRRDKLLKYPVGRTFGLIGEIDEFLK
jgi:hypothetical protein